MKKIISIITSLPVVLAILIGSYLFFKNDIDPSTKSFFYSISLSIKDCLVFAIPIIIASSLFSMLIELGKSSYKFIIKFLIAVCLSNLFCTIIAYCVGNLTLNNVEKITSLSSDSGSSLGAMWQLGINPLISNDKALLIGLIFGIIFSVKQNAYAEKTAVFLKNFVSFFLKRIFIPIVPIFILGFIIKLDYDNMLSQIFNSHRSTLVTIFLTQYIYIAILFLIAARFNFKQFFIYIKNVLPSSLTAFCTMSSAATMPITLQAAEKNTNYNPTTRAIVVGTTNIHLVGDSIGVPLMAMAILISFQHGMPSLPFFAIFALHFVIAKFCIAAVPGGGIIVMIPVMEQYLGFSPEMSVLISAFYVMFDPVNTAANVTGNGAFAILFSKLFKGNQESKIGFSPIRKLGDIWAKVTGQVAINEPK